ncbi:MAG: response regulator [Verrucomicrobiae bacterium]|nr:response regulator [Verrucomicrobiae bacterium]
MSALRSWFLQLPLARKLGGLTMATVFLAFVACLAAVMAAGVYSFSQEAQRRFAALADVLARECTVALVFENARDAQDTLGALAQDRDVEAAWILTPKRKVFAEYQRNPASPHPLPEQATSSALAMWWSRCLVIERPIEQSGQLLGHVVVASSLDAYEKLLLQQAGWMLLGMGLALLATGLVLRRLLRPVTAPIMELASVARQVSENRNYSVRARAAAPDEVGQLVHAFNYMLEAVQTRDAELEQARATLEQRVQERTAELQREVVERRQIEEELRRSEQRFAQIFRSSPLPIVLRGLDHGRILEVNQSFLQLFGYQREEVLGRSVEELGLNARPAQVKEISEKARKGGQLRDVEIQWRGKGGRAGTARLFAEVIEWIKEPCLLVMVYDTTRQSKMEHQLRQAQKMESVGQLAAGVAHDFNNILTIIQANASLGMSEPGLDPVVKDCLDQISQAADRAAALTRQLLAFSRRQNMQAREVDLNQLLVDYARMLHRVVTEKVKVQFNLTPELPPIHADPAMVEQVLANLALNARDAMPEGGTLTLATEEVELDENFAQHHPRARAGRFVRMQVADTGVGIAPDLLPRIFDPFFTTKEIGKGTGLGLAAVYGIVDLHGGWVEVESEVGRGATFSVFWPVHDGARGLPAPTADRSAIRGGDETILLVEDEPAVRGIARHVLKKYGYSVVEAISGKGALRLWPAIQDHVDMVVTDVVMPDGISGRQLAEELRRHKPSLPVLLVSGYSSELAGGDSPSLPGCKFMAKPFKPMELARVVREMLDQAKGGNGGNGSPGGNGQGENTKSP